MTEERFGELIGSIGYTLVKDASPEERAEILQRWTEVRQSLPKALIVAETAIAVGKEMGAQTQAMIEEATALFGPEAALQLVAKLRR